MTMTSNVQRVLETERDAWKRTASRRYLVAAVSILLLLVTVLVAAVFGSAGYGMAVVAITGPLVWVFLIIGAFAFVLGSWATYAYRRYALEVELEKARMEDAA